MKSSLVQTSTINSFPAFTGERVYMQKFHMQEGLPSHLARWQDTVDTMLEGVDTDNPIFIMIDQGIVKPNTLHRRGGIHIDGYWIEGISAHGGGVSDESRSHSGVPDPSSNPWITPGRHSGSGGAHRGSAHDPYPTPGHHGGGDGGSHRGTPGARASQGDAPSSWIRDLKEPEAIILTSNVQACRGWIGEWDGFVANGGDLSQIDVSGLQEVQLEAFKTYIGNVGFIHESLPIEKACERTLVRLNVKNWEPKFSH